MVKVDLITGFLGSGKTTFVKHYLRFLKSRNERVHIIENEFGDTSIDSKLLESQVADDCEISDLSGMCMCCVGKKEFISLLIDSANTGCDRIIVEPSGIYDVDEFFDVMSDSRVSGLCEIGSIITIVDPLMKTDLSKEARYLMFSQILSSGAVLISKVDIASKLDIDKTVQELNELMKQKGCEAGVLADVVAKKWNDFLDEDFEELEDYGYRRLVHDREEYVHSLIFQSIDYEGVFKDKSDLIDQVKELFNNSKMEEVYRVKGYAKTLEGEGFEVNCTGNLISVDSCPCKDNKLVIIGKIHK